MRRPILSWWFPVRGCEYVTDAWRLTSLSFVRKLVERSSRSKKKIIIIAAFTFNRWTVRKFKKKRIKNPFIYLWSLASREVLSQILFDFTKTAESCFDVHLFFRWFLSQCERLKKKKKATKVSLVLLRLCFNAPFDVCSSLCWNTKRSTCCGFESFCANASLALRYFTLHLGNS